MKKIIDEDFFLDSPAAVKLYRDCAREIPVIDLHSYLSSKEIFENKRISNITELWIYNDCSRISAMRACGVCEKYITGEGSDFEKFREYCRIMPLLITNPLYLLSHAELRRYFNCDLTINLENCEDIWKHTSKKLEYGKFGVLDLIKSSNVKLVCTEDDPSDDLFYHNEIKNSNIGVRVLPTFCPDRCFDVDKQNFRNYIDKLSKSTEIKIEDYDSLCLAYSVSLERFESLGCKTAAHDVGNYSVFVKPDKFHANEILKKALGNEGENISMEEISLWKAQMMRFFGLEYQKRNWVLQFRYGVADMLQTHSCVLGVKALIDYMQTEKALPKTVIYSKSKIEDAHVGALCSSFCQGNGKGFPTVVKGYSWNVDDSFESIASKINDSISRGGLVCISSDVRSCTSYSRIEYFRRILCNIVGNRIEKGIYFEDSENTFDVIRLMLYNNVKKYFEFEI